MKRFLVSIKTFLKDEDAPTMVEYGLLVILIAFVAIVGVTALGTSISSLFQDGANGIP